MSEVKVNKISPRSGTTVTLGDSGDTITLASGVSLTGVNATFSGNATVSGDLTVDTNTLYVDSINNRVGIGTTSPTSTLEVIGSVKTSDGGTQGISVASTGFIEISRTNGDAFIDFKTSTSEDFDVRIQQIDNGLRFETGGNGSASERMRIDSSGNVLVGKTSADNTTSGTTFYGVEGFSSVRISNPVAILNRLTSDGDIVQLRQDGTEHGTIGTPFNVAMYISGPTSTGAGLIFQQNQVIQPAKNKVRSDNSIDIGSSTFRFKDAYLGGNIYLGGTGSANALSDYEEGTFTPTFGGSTTDPTVSWNVQSGHYTKIGNIVHFNLTFYPSAISGGSGNLNIRGLPFTNRNHRAPASIIFDRVRILGSSTGIHPATVAAEVEQNTTYMAITAMNDAADEVRTFVQVSDLEAAPSDNPYIVITGTYTTD